MRVLLLCHGYPPDSIGGVEQHVSGLAHSLAAAGHEVHVYARGNLPGCTQGQFAVGPPANPRITRVAYRWEGVDSLAAIYTGAPMADALRRFLAERRAAGETFDVAHVHHLTGMSTDSLAALQDAGVPTVLTLHDYWLFCPRGQMFHVSQELCETAAPSRCATCLQTTFPHWLKDHDRDQQVAELQARALATLAIPQALVVPSKRAIPPFVALGVPAARFTVVANGVDTQSLNALPTPAAGPGPLRIGYLGTLLPSKGLHVLLAAQRRLPVGTVTVDIYGNAAPYHGDDGYLTRCFAELRPGDQVRYHGPYAQNDLSSILAGIDVLAAPALWHEAFGLTVREALAAGRPVLVSRVGGLQDAVLDNVAGRVLPPGDVNAWAGALQQLASDRNEVRRLAAAARRGARGFAAMTADLLAVYANVCAAVPRRA